MQEYYRPCYLKPHCIYFGLYNIAIYNFGKGGQTESAGKRNQSE